MQQGVSTFQTLQKEDPDIDCPNPDSPENPKNSPSDYIKIDFLTLKDQTPTKVADTIFTNLNLLAGKNVLLQHQLNDIFK